MRHGKPIFDIIEKMIAIAFSLPEMRAVLLAFLRIGGIKVFDKMQHNDFSQFKFA
jgi:hypothetical protein